MSNSTARLSDEEAAAQIAKRDAYMAELWGNSKA